MERTIIWESNPTLDKEDIGRIKKQMQEFGKENPTDAEAQSYFMEDNEEAFFDVSDVLDIFVPEKIVVIADIKDWRGKRKGHLVVSRNLKDILMRHVHGDSEICVYADGQEIRAEEVYHDGVNHYLFRMFKSHQKEEKFLDEISSGHKISSKKLDQYTESLHQRVTELLGWFDSKNPVE